MPEQNLDDYQVNVGSGELDKVAEEAKMKLILTHSTEQALLNLQTKMKGGLKIGKVVEIAIELLVKAEGKEIQLYDRSNREIVAKYYLWK